MRSPRPGFPESPDMPTTNEIYAVVLAAGRSTRFDGGKLTQPLNGKPLLHYSLTAAQSAFPGRVVLVVGHNSGSVTELSGKLADVVVFNPDYGLGQGSSLATGVKACRDDADAIVVMLADQPLVNEDTLRQLVGYWNQEDQQIVASDFGDALGPPVLFGKGSHDRLCDLTGDSGARSIIRSGEFDIVTVDIAPRGLDVDTPQDLQTASQFLSAEK